MYRLGFTTVTFRKLTRRQVCRLAKENNIKYLEWGGDVHLPPHDEKALNEVVALQKEFDLQAVSYGSYYRLGEKNFEHFEKILETAKKTGAERVRLWMGKKSSKATDEKLFEEYLDEGKKLSLLAKEKGLTLSFEFHEGTFNDTGKSSLEFLETLNCENVKTYWQPLRTKADFENLRAVAKNTDGVHVFNWGKLSVRHSLEKGREDWKSYITYLRNNSPNKDFILEFVKGDSPLQFQKDVTVLRELLEEIYKDS